MSSAPSRATAAGAPPPVETNPASATFKAKFSNKIPPMVPTVIPVCCNKELKFSLLNMLCGANGFSLWSALLNILLLSSSNLRKDSAKCLFCSL